MIDARPDKPVGPPQQSTLEGWARIIGRMGNQATGVHPVNVEALSTEALFTLYSQVEAELQRRNELG